MTSRGTEIVGGLLAAIKLFALFFVVLSYGPG
ncbi:hypothetical protein HNR17_000845 [Galbitalea soli]|nr:hypothetical protein [Galbitalea soli]